MMRSLLLKERVGSKQEWLGEDGRSNDEDAYVSEELASNEDTMAMCSKINYILEHTILMAKPQT